MYKVSLAFVLFFFCPIVSNAAPSSESTALVERAKAGDAEAAYLLGKQSAEAKDFVDAEKWFEKAAERGHHKAQVLLASIALEGTSGKKPNPVEAYAWLLIGADASGDSIAIDLKKTLEKKLTTEQLTAAKGMAISARLMSPGIGLGPTADIEAMLPAAHPATYYVYAKRLFELNRKEDAVFWFYAGQIRFRFHLAANPNLPGDRDPALFSSLSSTVGQFINEYAGSDPKMWIAQIDRALKWDAETKNEFTQKEKFKVQWEETRTGLQKFRTWIFTNPEQIKQQRERAGLPNK